MRLFENAQDSDDIEVTIEENVSDKKRSLIWKRLCKYFLDREDDDATVFTTIKKFRNYLDKTEEDIDDYQIYLDGDLIYDKYALIYETDVDY